MSVYSSREGDRIPLGSRLLSINWGLVLLVIAIAAIGVAMLYSSAGGKWDPWAGRQLVRFIIGLGVMIVVALIDISLYARYAYFLYGVTLVGLVGVEVMGSIGMGAQRWIDLGFFQIQPSEIMKLALVLALARYFHGVMPEQIGRPTVLIVPLLMVLAPVALVLKQPNLGTATLLLAGSGAIFFLAGVRLWKFGIVIAAGLSALPIVWEFMHDYQRRRVLTFLNPEADPLGAGYNILQSMIALGSGGVFGKGYLLGTQSQLRFVPEVHTDFIFPQLAEEFGMIGGLLLILLYICLFGYALAIGLGSRHQFGRLVALGIGTQLFLYVFINLSMVMGLIPVVGIPLPLVSYGGSATMTLMIGVGLILSVSVHRERRLPRRLDHS
ncbi:rod shape-determining protein RodA [Zavarzinia aquatilis]|uniref:Peptidoglycan glycosyltransferase MrdB n=1 Tax=Zavarzinia aquatilis TaxID=2211142 RepID=A0A317EJS3_9PROT|nr:rod shape-determining protein RodA [Zavarzinia aquatilis]PWR25495.1 rod shape-determining protein RodA [Zavarzinia aquatilis]